MQQMTPWKETFLLQCFTKETDAFARKFESCSIKLPHENTPCFIEHSNKIDIFIGKIACTVCMFRHGECTCYHMPVGSHTVVTEHGVGTHRFCSNLCSGFDLVSLSLGRTPVLGLELGTRLRFVD